MPEHEAESAVYDLARETYATEEHRFEEAESKITRYLSVLSLVLGASVIGVERLKSIPINSSGNQVFLAVVVVFYVSGLAAFLCFLRALRVQDIRSLVLGREVVDYFGQFALPDALRGLAVQFLEAAANLRTQTQAKMDLAATGFLWMLATIVFAVLSGVSYYSMVEIPPEADGMAVENEQGRGNEAGGAAEEPEGGTPASGGGGSGGGGSPGSTTEAAENAAAKLFTTVKRGFEGGKSRDD